MVLGSKKIVFTAVLLAMSIALAAQQTPADKQQPSEQEQMIQRLYEAQASGNDSAFYAAHQAFMSYQEQRQDWATYYRSWMNRVIYEVNNKRFHRAYAEIHRLADDAKARHQEQYLYLANMSLGFLFNGRNQPELGEKYFWRALRGLDAKKDPVAVFNAYLSLAQSLSFKQPAEAMACLDSLPKQMLQNPMYESGVLGYRCIIANKLDDRDAFYRYFASYDSIRQHQPAQFNAANLEQVMVCHHLMQKDYQGALAWCDSIEVPLTATELRINVYEKMGNWQQAFRATEFRDSLMLVDERASLEQRIIDMSHDIDMYQAEQEKAESRVRSCSSLASWPWPSLACSWVCSSIAVRRTAGSRSSSCSCRRLAAARRPARPSVEPLWAPCRRNSSRPSTCCEAMPASSTTRTSC